MIQCDLCGQEKACRPREIEGKQYDICSAGWKPWAQKLKGKGRAVGAGNGFLASSAADHHSSGTERTEAITGRTAQDLEPPTTGNWSRQGVA